MNQHILRQTMLILLTLCFSIGFSSAIGQDQPQRMLLGKFIVKFHEGVELNISRAYGTVMTGIITMDHLNIQFRVQKFDPLLAAGIYVVVVPDETDIERAAEKYATHPDVEYATPIFLGYGFGH